MSDEWAAMGKATLRGVEIAIEEVNRDGGVSGRRIELVLEDTQEANGGARAVNAYRNLRQRGVQWFIGPAGAPGALSLAPILVSDPIVMITPTVGVRNFSDAGRNLFNSRGIDEQASAEMARVAFSRGWKKAAILASQQPWEQAQGEAFGREFKKLGGMITAQEFPLPETNDFRTTILKLLAGNPEVIFLSNYNRVGVAAKQLAQSGYTGPRLTTVLDSSALEIASGALNEAEFASFVGPTEIFRKKFREKFEVDPDLGADTAYDATFALVQSLRETSGSDASKVSERLSSIQFEGAAGHVSFDTSRIASRRLKRFIVKNGHIEEMIKEG
ncbi:MAG: ABC transporter substrate-binding protein [Deltaproteobacteria bacterium]|nr:ABC transporter substrate-binding protein [Deltaproteobacteria bacterium]